MPTKRAQFSPGKKALVKLLDGPKKARDLNMKNPGVLNYYKTQGYVDNVQTFEGRRWRLTEKGMREAAKWSYDLKLANAHPEQDVSAARVPVREWPEHVTEGLKPLARPELTVDWQQRHIDFLEEIVRNMTSNKNQ